ncbi:MAG: hypothetical protein NC095_08785 [Muribaculum sp.]|nr:hypothetical protein [Muribaculum sp.]
MKKFALLFSSFAVVASSVAATPELNENLPKANVSESMSAKKVATETKGEKVRVNDYVSKKVASKAAGFSVSYEEPENLFALGLSEQLSGFQGLSMRKGPAYTPLTWTNTSTGASAFEWAYTIFTGNSAGKDYSSDIDLVHSEIYSNVDAPVLTAVSESGDEGTFQMNPDFYGYSYGGDCNYSFRDGDVMLGMTTYMYDTGDDAGWSRFAGMAYAPGQEGYVNGVDDVFTTPEPNGFGFSNVEFVGYANVFHKPISPYFISKMWCWMYIQAKKNTVVEMTLYKLNEDGNITDEILAAGSANVLASSSAASQTLSFDLFALDEDGLETDDLIVVDSGFIAVMTFNKEDLVTVNCIAGTGATYPANEQSPYTRNAIIVLNADGEESYSYSPFSYYTDNTRTTLMSVTDWCWMVDAVFPFALTADGEDIKSAPVEGGMVDFDITCLYNISSLSWGLEEDCDWIDLEKSTIDSANQKVSFAVNPLPEGVTGRTATITMNCPATPLVLTINQGDVTGVSIVEAENSVQYFDLTGRRVANPEKGIYVKVSGNKSEKVVL